MISKIKLFILDCFAWGRGYKQQCCCLLCVYYLYSHLVPYFLLDHVVTGFQESFKILSPPPLKVSRNDCLEWIYHCLFFLCCLEPGTGLHFCWKSSRGYGQKLRQFLENLSIDFTELSENTKHGGKDPNWEKQNNQTTIENKQTCKTEQHIEKLSLRYQNPVPVKKPFQGPVLIYVCKDPTVGNERIVREIKWPGAVRKARKVQDMILHWPLPTRHLMNIACLT